MACTLVPALVMPSGMSPCSPSGELSLCSIAAATTEASGLGTVSQEHDAPSTSTTKVACRVAPAALRRSAIHVAAAAGLLDGIDRIDALTDGGVPRFGGAFADDAHAPHDPTRGGAPEIDDACAQRSSSPPLLVPWVLPATGLPRRGAAVVLRLPRWRRWPEVVPAAPPPRRRSISLQLLVARPEAFALALQGLLPEPLGAGQVVLDLLDAVD